MAYDFALDSDGQDLPIVDGKFSFTETVRQLLRQRILITFRTFKGEWFKNINFGVYDKNLFLNKSTTKGQIDAYLISIISDFPEVDNLKFFESSFDNSTRTLSVTFVVVAAGEQGTFRIDLTPPDVEINYPDPTQALVIDGCEIPIIAQTNEYYEFINIDLATTSSWLE